MPPWNETHYARAQEFARLLSDALASAAPALAPPVRTAAPVAPPPSPAPAPAPVPAVATPPPPPTAGATAANLFKKIPWKK